MHACSWSRASGNALAAFSRSSLKRWIASWYVSYTRASVAPAYSIAVTLGLVTLVVGHLAPAALVLGFVPILLTAFAFRELNREMPDCGTNFVWTTRAFGPVVGWISGGWVPIIATLIA